MISAGLNIKKIRKKKHWTQEYLAEKLGCSSVQVGKWEKASDNIEIRTVKRIADILNVPLSFITGEQLIDLDKASDYEYVFIPQVAGRISAGGGLEPDNTIELKMAFRKDWVERKGNPNDMSIIRVLGDSMEPTLQSGDLVLINHSRNYIDPQGGIYALAIDGQIMLKRVQLVPSKGHARIISDNPQYETEIVPLSQLVVNGKMIWFGRETVQ
ncbi:MAG: helix-turn-helix transcriptional regulator [Nitrospinae bacterium]|jgi:phage repressor protein C with HTH and peptisase S24 domain|nr:helix-turn-helix transcriptional regulator [Nitrospinota bacterium]MBT3875179.1 helix-turn-helix transcriptional regulator [Nitrospina sp.]MBT6900686.1 helix-turn-helix transcriptional regulator [Nitrospina sp.]